MAEHAALRQALARLRRIGAIPKAAPALERALPRAGQTLRKAVIAEVPALSAPADPAVRAERDRHAAEHLEELHRLFAGGEVGDFEFVRTHAQRRAEQHFPLEAMLHAYRCGHQVLSRWMRAAVATLGAERREQAVSAVSDLGIEYTNAISTVLTAEYVAHTRQMAEAEGDRRADTLTALLNPDGGADGHDAQLLKRAGYLEPNQAFCVAVAQSTDPLEMHSVPRVQRIAEAMSSAVTSEKIKSLVGVRSNVVTAVYNDWQRQSGWTAPRANLADRVERMLLVLGPAVLIGISREQASAALVPRALQEATAALGCAHVGERVVKFGALPMRRVLLQRGGDYLRAALPPWVADFTAADARARGKLVETLRAYADADMNLIRAARDLEVHPNTLYARMQRIRELTGLDCQRYHDLNELLLAVDCQGS